MGTKWAVDETVAQPSQAVEDVRGSQLPAAAPV